MTSTNEIRAQFLDYFKANKHEVVPSSALVPHNDPTLMFTAAGMVQFKNVFTGKETRPYTRATSSQKCVRAGGKHNDLENVGHTARHHTFFEMLGNFSFGDYFKEDAISYAWNLVTKDFGLPKDKLLTTVYAEDEEAFNLWKKIAGLPEDRIIKIATSDNFWSAGDTGPCGPCTEIFFDHGDKIFGGPPGSADQDGDRFIEIWNLVFMQFDQQEDGTRLNLPKPSVDTGMGLERIAAVLQGKHDNYDIDLMRALIEASAHASNTDPDGSHRVSHRVIADHLRASCFLIADGVLPSNEGRGYVLRRIMRRGMRHAHMLGCRDPHMYRLVPELIRQMGGVYGELGRAEALITETLRLEETRFKKTLDKGLALLADETAKLGDKQPLNGEVAFRLYDTYGFPLDLTQDVLKGQNREVDIESFNKAMERQRAEARKSWAGSGEAATETVWFDLKEKFGATEFLGYATEKAEGQVKAIIKDGKPVERATKGDKIYVVTNQTPFYGESGGQVGDKGTITAAEGKTVLRVTDTQKKLGVLFVHEATVEKGDIATGDAVMLEIDASRRNAVRANHSATHLLHEALRRRLGKHVSQKGSLVNEQRLRFDISHPQALSAEEIRDVEDMVNDRIRANVKVETRLMPIDEAIESGALAMFGEKYDEEVRVLSMGGADVAEDGRVAFSVELCGGTHVRATGDIGLFKIVSESAVAAGVRRIEAVTGAGALAYLRDLEQSLNRVAGHLKTGVAEVEGRVAALLEDRKKLERELSDTRRKLASGGGGGGATETKTISGIPFAAKVLQDIPAKDLKPMVDDLKQQLGSAVVTLVSVSAEDGKASIVVGVTSDLTAKINAVDLVRVGAEALGGKGGGGRPDMAQAGGPDGNAANDALSAIEKVLAS